MTLKQTAQRKLAAKLGKKLFDVTQADADAEMDRYIDLAAKAEKRRDASEYESTEYWRHHDVAMMWHDKARLFMPEGS